MKTILCYGDSNTWGQIPLRDFVKSRYDRSIRWTARLESLAGLGYRVIEEGNNGRTTGLQDPVRAGRNGLDSLPACLDSAVPVDLVILMLGTNDLKMKYQPTPESITARMRELIRITKTICAAPPNNGTQILLMSPPLILPEYYAAGDFNYPEAIDYARALAPHYLALAESEGVHFLDMAPHVVPSVEDGAHLDADNHRKFAEVVWQKVQTILK